MMKKWLWLAGVLMYKYPSLANKAAEIDRELTKIYGDTNVHLTMQLGLSEPGTEWMRIERLKNAKHDIDALCDIAADCELCIAYVRSESQSEICKMCDEFYDMLVKTWR